MDSDLPRGLDNFEHHPLVNPNQHFRLMRLLPAVAGSEQSLAIHCEVIHEDFLARTHKYEALSYAWGPTDSIRCDIIISTEAGQMVYPITRNLFNIIRQVQFVDRERFLWIDQICLNEADSQEKVRQMGMMDLIYNYAEEVIMWLDDESETMKRALHCLALISSLERVSELPSLKLTANDIDALNQLFNCPWVIVSPSGIDLIPYTDFPVLVVTISSVAYGHFKKLRQQASLLYIAVPLACPGTCSHKLSVFYIRVRSESNALPRRRWYFMGIFSISKEYPIT